MSPHLDPSYSLYFYHFYTLPSPPRTRNACESPYFIFTYCTPTLHGGNPPWTFYFETCKGKSTHNTPYPLPTYPRSRVQETGKSPRTVDDARMTRSQMRWGEGCTRRPLQLLLVQRQNVILQRHDLPESVSAFKYHPCGLCVDRGDMTETYDLLVISELEVVLHYTIFIPGGVRTVSKAGVGSKWKQRERTS